MLWFGCWEETNELNCCIKIFITSVFEARISGLEDEVKKARQALSKAESEKRQLQEKLTDLEKVTRHLIPSYLCYL